MSHSRLLPNGNTIMVQACDKRIVEVMSEGEIVLDLKLGGLGRIFRVYTYAPDYPEIEALVFRCFSQENLATDLVLEDKLMALICKKFNPIPLCFELDSY